MKVFKFGGASIKDAAGVKNVANILNLYKGESLIVVISALGKTTNLMEEILRGYFEKKANLNELLLQLKKTHFQIALDLDENGLVLNHILEDLFEQLEERLQEEPSDNFDYEYDKIVSFGEILSTNLISAYLNMIGIKNKWLDARKLIKTDHTFREGKVDWEKSVSIIREKVTRLKETKESNILITQGFISGTSENITTTLGREGSDYSAAILAFAIDAESVTIWKDVPGLLNADPKFFPEAVKLDEISYEEAIELSYYGATIIHPKTIKPLQNKNIPLYVKSFCNPQAPGSLITGITPKIELPSYIFKRDQILITVFPKDFSFIAVDNLNEIFSIFSKYKLKINLMQNSALTFSVCLDDKGSRFEDILTQLMESFEVKYNRQLTLLTFRNYAQQPHFIDQWIEGKLILVEQRSRNTAQYVISEK